MPRVSLYGSFFRKLRKFNNIKFRIMRNKNSLISTFANKFLADTADTIRLNVLKDNRELVIKFLWDLKMTNDEIKLLRDMCNKLNTAILLLTNIENWNMLSPLMVGDADETKKNYQLEFNAVMDNIFMIAYLLK